MKILIIIPAYNESNNIENLVSEIKEIQKNIDIEYLIVNDCSTDNTLDILKSREFCYVTLPQNLGIGGAVQTGYKYAEKYGYDLAVQIDGDGQHDVKEIKALVQVMLDTNADMVIGSRYIDKEGFQSSTLRRLGIIFLSALVKIKTGSKVLDITSGCRLVNRKMIEMFADDYPTDYPESESTTKAILSGCKVVECPVIMRERQGGGKLYRGF